MKSQGLCCRHGAKPKMCMVEGCGKQAQGNFDGMCKSHFKVHNQREATKEKCPSSKSKSDCQSVYDSILPASAEWTSDLGEMPLVAHLREGFEGGKPKAWHRNEERIARGFRPVNNPAIQLEGWEREVAWMEILVLAGCPEASFRHLARGWGRDKGFHMVLAQFICQRHGSVERKKRQPAEAQLENTDHVNDIWDDACYGDAAYNESLAADLIEFSEAARNDANAPFLTFEQEEGGEGDEIHENTNDERQASIGKVVSDEGGLYRDGKKEGR